MKTKNKFNIIDVFVIIIIFALIAGIVLFALYKNGVIFKNESTLNVTYTVCFHDVNEEYIPSFQKNNEAFNSSTMEPIGTVIDVTTRKSTSAGSTASPGEAEGEYVLDQNEKAGVYDVYLTIKSEAYIDERGVVYVSSQKVVAGAPIYVRCGNYAAQGFITSFNAE